MLQMLTKCVDVVRPAPMKDASGGITSPQVFTSLYTGVPCSIQPASDSTVNYYAVNHIQVTHALYTNQNLKLAPGDQVNYGSRRLIVQGFRNFVELGVVFCIDCLEITQN